jgi:hypothetical protein
MVVWQKIIFYGENKKIILKGKATKLARVLTKGGSEK